MMTPFEAYEILGFDQSMELTQGTELVMAMVNDLIASQDLERLALVQEAWETVKPYLFTWSKDKSKDFNSRSLDNDELGNEPDQPLDGEEEDPYDDEEYDELDDDTLDKDDLICCLMDMVLYSLSRFAKGPYNPTKRLKNTIKAKLKETQRIPLPPDDRLQGDFLLEIYLLAPVMDQKIINSLAKIAFKSTKPIALIPIINSLPDLERNILNNQLKTYRELCPMIYELLKPLL